MEKGNPKPKAEKPKVADREIHAAPSDRQILSDRERRAAESDGLQTFFFPKENPPVAVRAASAEEAARIIAANHKTRD